MQTVVLALALAVLAVFFIRPLSWLVSLLVTFVVADILGNTLLLLLGGWKKTKLHSKYFFIARSKWDTPRRSYADRLYQNPPPPPAKAKTQNRRKQHRG